MVFRRIQPARFSQPTNLLYNRPGFSPIGGGMIPRIYGGPGMYGGMHPGMYGAGIYPGMYDSFNPDAMNYACGYGWGGSPVSEIPKPYQLRDAMRLRTGGNPLPGPGLQAPVQPGQPGQAPPNSVLPDIYANAVRNLNLTRQADGSFRLQGNNDLVILAIPSDRLDGNGGVQVAANGVHPAGTAVFFRDDGPGLSPASVHVVTNPATGAGVWRPLSTFTADEQRKIKNLARTAYLFGLTPTTRRDEAGNRSNILQPMPGSNQPRGPGISYIPVGDRILMTGDGVNNPRLILTTNDTGRVGRTSIELTEGPNRVPINDPNNINIVAANLREVKRSGVNGAPVVPGIPGERPEGRYYYLELNRTVRVYNPTTSTWVHPNITINGTSMPMLPSLLTRVDGMFEDGFFLNSSGPTVMLPNGDLVCRTMANNTHCWISRYRSASEDWVDWDRSTIIATAPQNIRTAINRIDARR